MKQKPSSPALPEQELPAGYGGDSGAHRWHPLFVEEMTKAVLEAESEGEARQTAASVPSSIRAVPATLHASLMARLDRLGPAKELTQIGAAIGREFPHPLLAAIVRKPEAELGSALDRLTAAGLLFRQGTPPNATYLFKHALVQDAAYGTLLREPRRVLHARIAETLESQFADIAESQPELLARHCTEAGLIEKAAGLWGRRDSGRWRVRRWSKPPLSSRARLIRLRPCQALLRCVTNRSNSIAITHALMHTRGHAAPETKLSLDQARASIERTEELGEPLEDRLLLFSVLYGFWVANYVAFDGEVVRDLAEQFLTVAEKQKAKVPRMIGHRLVGTSLLFLATAR